MGRKKIYTDEELRAKRKEYHANYYKMNKEKLADYKKEYYENKKDEFAMRYKMSKAKATPLTLDGHSFMSPSALHRALVCPASVTMCKDLPEETSVYAEEGTAFHALLEYDNTFYESMNEQSYIELAKKLLENKHFSDSVIQELGENWYKTTKFLSEVRKGITDRGFEIEEYKEVKMPMYYNENDSGTMDLGWLCRDPKTDKYLVVALDYKYGRGVDVSVENNPQLISYALSFINYVQKKCKSVDVVAVQTIIYQPRLEPSAKRKGYKISELLEQAKFINDGVEVVYDVYNNNKDLYEYSHVSDEGCKFCKAKSICKKYNEEMTVLLGDIVEDVSTKSVSKMVLTDDEIKKLLEFEKFVLPKIEEYIKVIKSSVEQRMIAGENIEGLKLVSSTTRIKWIDDKDKIINTLQEVGIDAVDHAVSIKPIGAIKKLIKTNKLEDNILKDLTVLPEGKPQVVLDTDNREALSINLLGDL